ncbi:MAG: VWA domain-containing protein [Gemmataceae bacterium]|nr:VWA domain-containing protein [Planctomycetia bacterium]MBX3401458.1 VWA domain-containing protein [Gemmataceae bacterium]
MTNFALEFQEFLSTVRFGNPGAFWLALAPAFYAIGNRGQTRRDRSRLAALGRPGAIAALRTGTDSRPGIARLFVALAWLALVIAFARPYWGEADERGVAVGRDIVIAIDFSRSMWAEDMADRERPARWQAAIATARGLVAELRGRGGHRVAVVVFAARPTTIVPLTTDYDHVDFRLDELDATTPPAEIRPADDAAVSGTRIGAALAAAIAAHDPRFSGFQEIVLLTDGDDPAGDEEWRTAIPALRRGAIPVHVVAIGDPIDESFIFHRGVPLESPDKAGVPVPVQTRLHEDVAEAIATGTGGKLFATRRETADARDIFQRAIKPGGVRELDDERLPQPRDRSAPFVGGALVFLTLAWWRTR